MKTKIQIKSISGKLLFESEKEDNCIKNTVIEAIRQDANLGGADLGSANLYGADLGSANLYGADLRGADLSGADLSDANLSGANLYGANLGGANLRSANLYGADLRGIKIKRAIVFTGLYKFIVIPFISDDNEKYIKMGCYTRKLSEWKSDFWNNDNEFPNNGSEMSNLRLFACETAERWFDVIDLKQKP